jgi:hypothetical protein
MGKEIAASFLMRILRMDDGDVNNRLELEAFYQLA